MDNHQFGLQKIRSSTSLRHLICISNFHRPCVDCFCSFECIGMRSAEETLLPLPPNHHILFLPLLLLLQHPLIDRVINCWSFCWWKVLAIEFSCTSAPINDWIRNRTTDRNQQQCAVQIKQDPMRWLINMFVGTTSKASIVILSDFKA